MLDEPILGGMMVCRPQPITYELGRKPVGLTLMSDLHIGASHVDYKRITRDLERAKENKDRILINGDVFDMILAKDFKRYEPAVLHPRLAGRNDIVNAAVDFAVELLGPYATQIDMIGIGNHEATVQRYNSSDVAKLLIYELQRKVPKDSKHIVFYGGYGGFVDYRLRYNKDVERVKKGDRRSEHGSRYVVHYFHGAGGDAPMTRGMLDMSRRLWAICDLSWLGHKHWRWSTGIETVACPLAGWEPLIKERREIMTGAYFQTYRGQTQESVATHGRHSNYAADGGKPSALKGGARVELTVTREGEVEVEVRQ